MSDEIEYEENDEKYTELESNEVDYSHALYEAECVECGRKLEWVLQEPDLDHMTLTEDCCGHHYSLSVTKAQIHVWDNGL